MINRMNQPSLNVPTSTPYVTMTKPLTAWYGYPADMTAVATAAGCEMADGKFVCHGCNPDMMFGMALVGPMVKVVINGKDVSLAELMCKSGKGSSIQMVMGEIGMPRLPMTDGDGVGGDDDESDVRTE